MLKRNPGALPGDSQPSRPVVQCEVSRKRCCWGTVLLGITRVTLGMLGTFRVIPCDFLGPCGHWGYNLGHNM